jgi:hypothetical protein
MNRCKENYKSETMTLHGFHWTAVVKIVWKGKVRVEIDSHYSPVCKGIRGWFFYRGLWLDRGAKIFTSAEVGRNDRRVRSVV